MTKSSVVGDLPSGREGPVSTCAAASTATTTSVREEHQPPPPSATTPSTTTPSPPDGKLVTVGRTIYGFFRLLCILCHNVYHVVGFFVVTWIILLPLYYLRRTLYYRLENHLYTWCLYTVGSWSWLAGIRVVECGDDIYHLLDKRSKSCDQLKSVGNNNRLNVINDSEPSSPTRSRTPVAQQHHQQQHQQQQQQSNLINQSPAVNGTSPIISPTVSELNAANEAQNQHQNEKSLPSGDHPKKSADDEKVKLRRKSYDEEGLPDRRGRIILLSNHQSMGDVPLMFQAFIAQAVYVLLWVMDNQFKFTHFGIVSATHGDYFIKPKRFKKTELTKHCQAQQDKEFVILFPEGGFLYKRLAGSDRFAAKQNWPLLKHLTWPRSGAFYDLVDESLGITHVVDLAVLYPSQEHPISIADIVFGLRPGPVYFYYRVFEVSSNVHLDEKWLNERWLEKEHLMAEFYANKDQFLANRGGHLRPVQLSWLKMIGIHIFYLAVCYWVYFMVRLAIWFYCETR